MKKMIFGLICLACIVVIFSCNTNNKPIQKQEDNSESVLQNEETETPEIAEESMDSLEKNEEENDSDE